MVYEKGFREEALRLSDTIGLKNAALQLKIPYNTLADWRSQRKAGTGGPRYGRTPLDPKDARIYELEQQIAELRRTNELLQDALGYFVREGKSKP